MNFCAHSDYFAAAHPTIRVFSDRIVMQNPGRFILAASEFRNRVLSMPRNPSIIKFFRHPRLSENAGYGIDKILRWKELTGKDVIFESDILIATVTYPLSANVLSRQEETGGVINGVIKSDDERIVLSLIQSNNDITVSQIAEKSGFSPRKVDRLIAALKEYGVIRRIGSNKTGSWEILM